MKKGLIPLNKKEVLRYLGYKRGQELTGDINAIVEEMMVEVQKVSNARYLYQIFDIEADNEEEIIRVLDTELVLTGKAIWRHLHKAQKVALLGCTLGIEVEQAIRRFEITDLTRALVLDCACTEYIEKVCDLAECDIAEAASMMSFSDISQTQKACPNYTLNQRFSPGYGDLPLAIQPTFIQTIQADTKLGITLTETNLMIPRKSVTAIIGLFTDPAAAKPRRRDSYCREYDFRKCDFRIGGQR
ncbi:methionine synthase [Enterococcus sp. AD013-P3]|uniref:methionine synthase n=1 Tax=Enterococcus sp. AD013-P3 TaxID=3411036 RepID=UPI003B9563C6